MYSEIHVAKAIKLWQAYSSENKNDFLTEGVMLLDNFSVLLLFFSLFGQLGGFPKS